MSRSPARLVLLYGWLVPVLVATIGMVVVPARLNPDLPLAGIVAVQMAMWLPWAAWSQLIIAVGDRVPLERGRVLRAMLVHVPLCLVVVTVHIIIVDWAQRTFGIVPPRKLDSVLAIGLRSYGDVNVVVYWAVVGAHVAMRWHEAWRLESVRAARLTSDLAQAQLSALRAQLHPHFLFNALNAVVALVGEDPAAAKRVTVRLAELLRATLAATERSSLPLREELELTRRYLEIEQVRFGERLTVDWSVDEALLDADVPAFVLQPLVENALVHAVAPRAAGGRVEIVARSVGEGLQLAVCDDGAGPQPRASTRGNGVGLRNLRDRLERLYDGLATLNLATRSGGGAEVTVVLPLSRPAPTAPVPPQVNASSAAPSMVARA
ncbi:MAG: histidine kinase [Gemmatimonadetes bacterium]|nr:histidine kinase [Gemmatimonadota bacterium]